MIDRRILLGITGASGSIYAERFLECIVEKVPRVYIVASKPGFDVAHYELTRKEKGLSLLDVLDGKLTDSQKEIIRLCKCDDYFSPIASGSSAPTDMVVLPCSTGTLGRIAGGLSTNLLERAADVCLKEKRKLVLCPRETPYNTIHLANMLSLSKMGVDIVPPVPAFYQKPKNLDDMVDFVVGKVLEALGFEHNLYRPWNSRLS